MLAAPVRIRFTSYFYPPCIGGGEVILQHQAEELARRGHEVHVHTTPYTNLDCSTSVPAGCSVEGGVHVHRHRSVVLPFHNPLEKDAVTPGFLRAAWSPADLYVCVGFPSLHLDALLLSTRALHKPLVVQNYVTAEFLDEILAGEGGLNKRVRSRYWRGWVRPALARAERVIADSPAAAEALRTRLSLDNVRTHIGMAVDPVEFDSVTPERRAAVRAALGLGDDRVILAPSRVSRQKGADLLVDAARPLLREGWRLVITGPINEVEFADDVRRRIDHHPRIVLTQLPRDELVALFTTSDIVCLPSRGETVGGVVFEGMYAGALVIVSDAVEAARDDYLEDGGNGLMVPAEDVGALRGAIDRAMREPFAAQRAAGHRMVARRFTWAASVDRLLALYDEALHA